MAGDDAIIARPTDQEVRGFRVFEPKTDRVPVPANAPQTVAFAKEVVTASSPDNVVAGVARQEVITWTAPEAISLLAAVDLVLSPAARNAVAARSAEKLVIPAETSHLIRIPAPAPVVVILGELRELGRPADALPTGLMPFEDRNRTVTGVGHRKITVEVGTKWILATATGLSPTSIRPAGRNSPDAEPSRKLMSFEAPFVTAMSAKRSLFSLTSAAEVGSLPTGYSASTTSSPVDS